MNNRQIIEEAVTTVGNHKKRFQAPDVGSKLNHKYSRQFITLILRELVRRGELLREGRGRYTFYALPQYAEFLGKRIKRQLRNEDLKEHEVLDEIEKQATFLAGLKENVGSILTYAFSEMLNNAIEHSLSKNIHVEVSAADDILNFEVTDEGIGVFRNVMEKRKLGSELEAIQDLLKGKTTTAPQAHSGEGIFFTSKIADVFVLDSHKYRLRVDNIINDVFIEQLEDEVKGTKVQFELALNTKKHLNDIFVRYQTNPGEHDFNKTEILIKLYTMGTIYISRSQARRVMSGLEKKFKVIVLDFDKVPTVGQAFADEVFRVFKAKHPSIEIKAINTNEAVRFMIDRVAV